LDDNKTEVKSILSSTTTTGKVTVRVQLLLTTVRSGRLSVQGITDRMGIPLLMQLLHINDLHLQLGQSLLALVLGGSNLNVGTVMVELIGVVGGPREGEEALVRVGTSGDVLGDLHGPFVVEIGASLGVLTNDVPGLAGIVRQGELAGTTTVAGLSETFGRRELFVVRDLKVPEADLDDLSGSVLCDGTLLVTTYDSKVQRT